ncbi:MAG: ParB/RepB/Spo0J family partition protein [Bacteroidales bacterium]|nr:ParB/RepB/Spo0J family partition protein [Bacteroidales bacterium]
MKNKNKRGALGRGLEAILQSPDTDITSKDISGNYVVGAIANIEVSKIETNPFQPRTDFDAEALQELSDSIEEQGVIQPLTVRKLGYDKYQIISGERRLRAAKMIGLKEVPCYIRVANDEQMLELALIENTHREDLNAIEISISYQRLLEECNLTQEELSKRVGKKRSTIANYLRMLKLPAEVQLAIREGKVSMGQARTFISIEDRSEQLRLLRIITEEGISVRELEKKVKKINNPGRKYRLPEKYVQISEHLSKDFSAKVEIKRNTRGAGSIVFKFASDEEMQQILTLLKK